MLQDPKTMKSPLTGGKITLHWEWRDMEFRKEKYHVMFPYYRCEDTGEQFTSNDSDAIWYSQVHNQYCQKYGIPYTDEIIKIRERYALSAAKMSTIMGFGPNQWRKYEQEEIPSVSNGRMIRSIMNPEVFLDLVNSAQKSLSKNEYEKISSYVKALKLENKDYEIYELTRVYSSGRGIDNGFGQLSLERLKNIMLYLIENCSAVWCTKMNKLLFYTDFLSYKELGMSMTGLCYRAIDFGPVPERWDRVYSEFDDVRQEVRECNGYEGHILTATAPADLTLFSDDEIRIMDLVCKKFGSLSSRELSEISHQESAWVNHHADHELIPYSDAFEIICR